MKFLLSRAKWGIYRLLSRGAQPRGALPQQPQADRFPAKPHHGSFNSLAGLLKHEGTLLRSVEMGVDAEEDAAAAPDGSAARKLPRADTPEDDTLEYSLSSARPSNATPGKDTVAADDACVLPAVGGEGANLPAPRDPSRGERPASSGSGGPPPSQLIDAASMWSRTSQPVLGCSSTGYAPNCAEPATSGPASHAANAAYSPGSHFSPGRKKE